MTEDDWAAVRRADLFLRVPPAAIASIVGAQTAMVVSKGAILCRQGCVADCCFLLLDGFVKLDREGGDDASQAVLAIHGPGQAFMVAEALTPGGAFPATAETVSQARVLVLDAGRLRGAIAADVRIARAMLAAAALNLCALVNHVEELKTMTAPARLADFILDLSGARSGSAEVGLPYEKQLIANRLGMTPESLSRALAQLEKHGVQVNRDTILIRDVAALRAFLS